MRLTNRRGVLLGLSASVASLGLPGWAQDQARPRPEGGIGGTGIVGTLTEFGSLIVNGLRIETPSPEITDAFGALSYDALKTRQVLTVEAGLDAGGILTAARVHVSHPLAGQIGFVAADGRSGTVGGVPVQLEPDARGTLTRGQRVLVSGVWSNRVVLASRIDPTDGPDLLAGAVETAAVGEAVIAGQPVALRASERLVPGSYVTIVGRREGGVLRPDTLRRDRFFGAAGPLQNLSIEGYLQPRAGAPFFTVSGLGHSFDDQANLAQFAGSRTLFAGAYSGDFRVATGRILPESFSGRRDLNRQILAGTASAPLSAR